MNISKNKKILSYLDYQRRSILLYPMNNYRGPRCQEVDYYNCTLVAPLCHLSSLCIYHNKKFKEMLENYVFFYFIFTLKCKINEDNGETTKALPPSPLELSDKRNFFCLQIA